MRNRADSLAYQSERTLRELGDRISMGLRSEVESKVKAVRDALAQQDITRVRAATDDLERTIQRIGQEVYSQAGATAGEGTGGGEGAGASSAREESDTVEGEYREV